MQTCGHIMLSVICEGHVTCYFMAKHDFECWQRRQRLWNLHANHPPHRLVCLHKTAQMRVCNSRSDDLHVTIDSQKKRVKNCGKNTTGPNMYNWTRPVLTSCTQAPNDREPILWIATSKQKSRDDAKSGSTSWFWDFFAQVVSFIFSENSINAICACVHVLSVKPTIQWYVWVKPFSGMFG